MILLGLLTWVVVHLGEAKCPVAAAQGLGDYCYDLLKTGGSWYSAEEACNERGGHLASVSDGLTNALLQRLANNWCTTDFWLGGSADGGSNAWMWSDGTPFIFNNWAKSKVKMFHLVVLLCIPSYLVRFFSRRGVPLKRSFSIRYGGDLCYPCRFLRNKANE